MASRPPWPDDLHLDSPLYRMLEPAYEPHAQWDPTYHPDNNPPTPDFPPEWFTTPLCQQHWRPIPPIAEFSHLFEMQGQRNQRRQEILGQDAPFPLQRAFSSIISDALAALGRDNDDVLYRILSHVAEFSAITGNLVLHQKAIYQRARPIQYFPELNALVWPGHPAYPSGHSTQAHVIAFVLDRAMSRPDDRLSPQRRALAATAFRIAENREIAGVHFHSDTQAGAALARKCGDHLIGGPLSAEFLDIQRNFAQG